MRIRVQVTQEDIEKGVPCESGRCPIALAFCRAMPNAISVGVANDVEFAGKDGVFIASGPLPEEARDFIESFDDGLPVKPFEFDLDIPTGG